MMRLDDVLALARPRVSLMVGAAALFGGLLHGGGEPWRVFAAALGSVLVCAGCSALNQAQERGRDARMRRTRNRPLASGRMASRAGLVLCLSWLAPGLALYALSGGAGLLALGLAVPAVYNGLYTPLKPVTGLALLVGGLAGAAPPLAGWLAAGGSAADPRILAVGAAFYIWQVPHFWLIAQAHARDYERAGFRPPWGGLSPGLYRPLMALWMLAHFTAILAMAAAAPRSGPWVFATACMGAAAMAGFAALGRAGRARRAADITLAAALCCLLAV
ncbi:UbiA family prenyltransferase [Desulfocurvus sp. DL9XJH121]